MLVAYASGGGAARAVAEAVGRTLGAAGLVAEVRAADEVTGVDRYDAVVLGSDVAGDAGGAGWLEGAAELLESFQEALAAKPLWLFASTPAGWPLVQDPTAELIALTGPVGVGTFRSAAPDEPAIAAWALTIAAHLEAKPGSPGAESRARAERSMRMSHPRFFTEADARRIGEALHVTWDRFDVEQFRLGLDVELEHGRVDPATDVTHDDSLLTGKIALAHLNEFPDYYTRLAKMEAEAEAYWREGSVHG